MKRNRKRTFGGLAIGFGLLAVAAVLLWLVSGCGLEAKTTGVELSPDVDLSPKLSVTAETELSADTSTTGEARSGDAHASGAGPVQTTIGTIALGSGWLWAPVGLLAAVVPSLIARRRRRAVDRLTRWIEAMPDDSPRQKLKRNVEFNSDRRLSPAPDASARIIARSVKRMKRRRA